MCSDLKLSKYIVVRDFDEQSMSNEVSFLVYHVHRFDLNTDPSNL
jgi:hypothetical protein